MGKGHCTKPLPVLTADEVADFWAHVDIRSPDECWPWKLYCGKRRGGKFYHHCRSLIASRVAFFLGHGSDTTLLVCHTCDNPPCCNPAHLFEGTNADNMADMMRKGRHVNRGFPRGPTHPKARLDANKVRLIRRRSAAGEHERVIAADLGVDHCTVGDVLRGRTWSHVA